MTHCRLQVPGWLHMARTAVRTAVLVICMCMAALTGCSTGERVDLGQGTSGTLVAAIAGEPDQLDPQKTSAYFSFEVLENVFDTLVEPDANLEMQPALAESWEVSPDQLTWTFQLRPGVTFHDGSPVHRRRRRVLLPPHHRREAVQRPTSSAPSRGVRRRTRPPSSSGSSSPTPNLLTNLGGFKGMAIVSRAQRRERADRHPSRRHRTVRFARQKSGDSISLTANPNYWGGAAQGSRA